jgi:hypothetical protein
MSNRNPPVPPFVSRANLAAINPAIQQRRIKEHVWWSRQTSIDCLAALVHNERAESMELHFCNVRFDPNGGAMTDDCVTGEIQQRMVQAGAVEPFLYALRKYPDEIVNGSTTSCQTTSKPSDYGPDD